MVELLAPAGSREKLDTAIHFGADAVYVGGANFGLRAYADNFDEEGLKNAVDYAHSKGRRVYVTANIFARNSDFAPYREYLSYLKKIGVDAVIVTDTGLVWRTLEWQPDMEVHLSTQANTTNGHTVAFWAKQGVKRVVLARELSLDEIKEIKDMVGGSVELETFVHGAMCISYSGRCLLSNYLTGRDSNRGECVQACRWEYKIAETSRPNNPLTLTEDEKGSYILNSRDLNMIRHVKELAEAGIDSFKIEGRMKSEYYVGSVVNAYRRAIDAYNVSPETYVLPENLVKELDKTSHRGYTTGFYFRGENNVCIETSKPVCEYKFMARVLGYDDDKKALVLEQRNRFKEGDVLEVLSPDGNFNKKIKIEKMFGEDGEEVSDAKIVQQKLFVPTDVKLSQNDILRRDDGNDA
mgnify:FL=1